MITCARSRLAGGVKCWGNDFEGQLGNGKTETSSSSPIDVIGLTSGVTAIAARDAQTCAVISTGGVKCWGFNVAGQLGNGSTIDSAVPVDVVNLSGGVTSITAGVAHTCALLGPDAAKCWGSNGRGELGDGSSTSSTTPVDVLLGAASATPSPVTSARPTATAPPGSTPSRGSAPSPGSTPSPTSAGSPVTADVDGLAGSWNVSYSDGTPVTITFADGRYTVTAEAAMRLSDTSCDLPAGTVTATFTGSGGSYTGQSGSWLAADCSFLGSVPMTIKAEGAHLVASLANGGHQIFSRAVVPFRQSLATPAQITLDAVLLAQSLVVAAAIVLLIPFPSALFDNTLESNYDEVVGWGGSLRRRFIAPFRRRRVAVANDSPVESKPSDGWRSPPRLAFALLLGVLLGCFLDPTFGLSAVSVATFVGVLIGVLVTLFVFAVPRLLEYRSSRRNADDRAGWDPFVRAMPAGLLIAIACVLISRLTSFQPGYLYGLIIGVTAAHELSDVQSARTAALATVVMLVVAALAWIGAGWVAGLAGAGATPNLAIVVLQTASGDDRRRWPSGRAPGAPADALLRRWKDDQVEPMGVDWPISDLAIRLLARAGQSSQRLPG